MPQGNINAEKGQIYLLQGDSYDWLKKIPENSIDSVVCDPPYMINFMSKEFDKSEGNPAGDVEFWKLVLKTMKPGSHLLAAGIGRTHHRMMIAIEDAGFEIRDCVYHVFGSGFPKSHNIEKTLIKMGENEKAKEFAGFGTALKPAVEIWTLARKPLSEKTVALNVIKWGTGGINIDGCRVGTTDKLQVLHNETGEKDLMGNMKGKDAKGRKIEFVDSGLGRFPANFIHDGSDEVVGLFPETKTHSMGNKPTAKSTGMFGVGIVSDNMWRKNDSGSAARFFYCAKASKKDRNEGLLEGETSTHPCVKPTSLMQYLVRLVTPKGGTVLDPFTGSGSTGKACVLEGFDFIGIELDPEYCKIAEARIEYEVGNP